jgi:hypothetical protein
VDEPARGREAEEVLRVRDDAGELERQLAAVAEVVVAEREAGARAVVELALGRPGDGRGRRVAGPEVEEVRRRRAVLEAPAPAVADREAEAPPERLVDPDVDGAAAAPGLDAAPGQLPVERAVRSVERDDDARAPVGPDGRARQRLEGVRARVPPVAPAWAGKG